MSLRDETRAKKPRIKVGKEARVIPNKRAKPRKHKETFSDLLQKE